MKPITLETYKELEENGVYIHYIPEHYNDGTNLNFSIEFRKYKTQTGCSNWNSTFRVFWNRHSFDDFHTAIREWSTIRSGWISSW